MIVGLASNNKYTKMSDKGRIFEYSSLVMGSPNIPCMVYPIKKPSVLTSTKTFSRKTDFVSMKYHKMRMNRTKGRN